MNDLLKVEKISNNTYEIEINSETNFPSVYTVVSIITMFQQFVPFAKRENYHHNEGSVIIKDNSFAIQLNFEKGLYTMYDIDVDKKINLKMECMPPWNSDVFQIIEILTKMAHILRAIMISEL